jgi:hypothetical protein
VVAHHSQWWYGTTTRGADVFQNDFDVIAANDRVGLRPDDSGDGIEGHGINVGTYKLTASSAPYSPTELMLSQPSILARPAKVVTLAAGAHLQGTDSAIQSWDQITISIAVGAQTGDLIGVKAAGRGSSRLSVNAKQILKLGRSQIGTLTRVSNGIRIEFSTPQTTDFVEQVVRQLTFKSGRRAAGTRQAAIKIKNTSTNEQVDRAIQIGIA